MRPRHWLLVVPLVLAAGLSDSRAADEWKGSLNFTLGQTTLDDDVKPAEDQTHFGARWTFGKSSWPIMLAVDVSTSTGDGVMSESFSYYYYPYYYNANLNVDVDTTTLSFGVRKEWGKDKMHPFLGGGVEWTQVDMKADVEVVGIGSFPFVDDSDTDLGLWIDAGIYWRLGEHFNLGFNARYSDAEVSLQEEVFGTSFDMDVSGIGYGVLLGWGW